MHDKYSIFHLRSVKVRNHHRRGRRRRGQRNRKMAGGGGDNFSLCLSAPGSQQATICADLQARPLPIVVLLESVGELEISPEITK